jgi:nitroimidazol reductase NimA-like FMN-containing flavoprotein (pyridoxamine 5'-phosphate oxidase superfamily)
MALQKQLDTLSTSECLRLLGDHTFGRVAFMDHVGVLPMIIPVNYLLYDDQVTFRTGAGSKLGTALRGEAVAFEVDGLDVSTKTGWSVVVRGHAEVVTDALELAALWETRLEPWAPGTKPYYVRIETSQISGRRIRQPQLPALADYWWG